MDDVCEPESGKSPLMCMPQRLLDIMTVEYYAWWTIKAPNILTEPQLNIELLPTARLFEELSSKLH